MTHPDTIPVIQFPDVSPYLKEAARSTRTESEIRLQRLLAQIEASRAHLLGLMLTGLGEVPYAGAACAELGKIVDAYDSYDAALPANVALADIRAYTREKAMAEHYGDIPGDGE